MAQRSAPSLSISSLDDENVHADGSVHESVYETDSDTSIESSPLSYTSQEPRPISPLPSDSQTGASDNEDFESSDDSQDSVPWEGLSSPLDQYEQIDLLGSFYEPQPWSYDYINNSPLFTCLNVERQTVFRYSRAYLPESREHIFEVVKMGPRVHVCEYSNMLRLHEAGLPVPRPIEYVPHPPKASRAWRERSRGKDWNYIRMENIEGEILEAEWGFLTDAQRTLMAKEALRFLDTMRRLPTATGDGTEPKYHFPISYGIDNCAARLALPRVTDDEEYSDYFINSFIFHEGEYSSHQDLILKFRQRMLEWKSSDERGRRVVTELLDKHMPPREAPPVITHGAFTLWDIVFSRSTWKISAVLDWSTAGVYPSY